MGTIHWYCIDYWSRELGLDIAAIKRTALEQVGYLPGAQEFLSKLRLRGKRLVLVTNAHPVTLAIKNEQVRLSAYFDACYSTHPFQCSQGRRRVLAEVQRCRSRSCRSAPCSSTTACACSMRRARFGIAWLRAVRLPDSGRPAQDTGHYAAVDRVADLI